MHLPRPLSTFFRAENANDLEALALCFISSATVLDEGRTIEGVDAIKRWMDDAKRKYQHTVEPLELTEREGKSVVTARVSGNFPSSPVNLEHIFKLRGGKIASLEIH